MSRGLRIGFNQPPTTLVASPGKYGYIASPGNIITTTGHSSFLLSAAEGGYSYTGQAATLTQAGGGGGTGFALNQPAGLTTIFDRTFNTGDIHTGGAQDSAGLEWFISSSGNTAQTPFIETPAAASSRIGVTIPAPPDGNSTILEIFYPTGYTSGNTPFQLNWKNSGTMTFQKMYFACWVLMPSNFSSNSENIKWFGIAQGAASTNHIALLSSNGAGIVSATGSGKDYRSNWLGLQGGPGNQNFGGEGGSTFTPITQLTTTQFNPTGSGPGWWVSNYGVWVLCEWFFQQESPAGANNGIFQSWMTPSGGSSKLVNSWNNFSYNQSSGGVNAFNIFEFIPYYGGGGSSPTANEYICVSRMRLACA